MARDEDLTDATTTSDSGTWFADCSARFAKTAEDTVRGGAAMADRWPAHTANTLPTPASEISTPPAIPTPPSQWPPASPPPHWPPSADQGYGAAADGMSAACAGRVLQAPGSQNSSWMLSGSLKTITDPIGVSAIGVKVMPREESCFSQSSSSARVATPKARWSRPVRNSSNLSAG